MEIKEAIKLAQEVLDSGKALFTERNLAQAVIDLSKLPSKNKEVKEILDTTEIGSVEFSRKGKVYTVEVEDEDYNELSTCSADTFERAFDTAITLAEEALQEREEEAINDEENVPSAYDRNPGLCRGEY